MQTTHCQNFGGSNQKMRIQNKSLLLNFSGYTLINLLNSLTPFIILPLLTRNLTSSDIGKIDLFTTSSIFLAPIIGLCFIQSISKLYFSVKNTKKYLSALASSLIVFGIGYLLLAFLIVHVFNFFDLNADEKKLIGILLLYVIVNLFVEGFLLLKRNQENLRSFAFVRLLKTALDILLTILFLYLIDDFWARIYAIFLSTIITSLIVFYMVIKSGQISFAFDLSMTKKILIYSYPLVFHTFFASILNYADRYFINEFEGTSELGKYSVVYQICMVMSLFINSFNMAWMPYFMKNMTENQVLFSKKIKKLFKYYGSFLAVAGIIVYFSIPLVYKYYVGNEYRVDHLIYLSLILGYFFNGLYRFKVNHLFFNEKTFSVAKLSFLTAILNITLNYFCIIKWGILGAAIATFISYLALYLFLETELILQKRNESTV